MTTSGIGGTGGADTGIKSSASVKNKTLENMDFTTYITLLTVQLKNQDPMKPMDSQQFTSEIATYAQLEQQIKGNDLLEKMAQVNDYSMQAVAAGYLGKEILAEDNMLHYSGSGVVDFAYDIKAAGATNVELDIIDNATGKIVKTTKVDAGEGLHAVAWDGKHADGTQAAAGSYTIRVSANNAEGKVVPASTLTYVKAAEMIQQDGQIFIKTANGNVVSFEDIESVRNPAA